MRLAPAAACAGLATAAAALTLATGDRSPPKRLTIVPGAAPRAARIATPATMMLAAAAERYRPRAARRPTTGATLRLGKCINLSNMLEAPNEGDWGRAFRDADMRAIAARGFTGVRIPARFSAHAGTAPPYTIDPAFLRRVRHVVDQATANGIAAIVDMHHYEELFSYPTGQKDRFAAMWRQIASTFQDAPDSVYFELINEPQGNLTRDNLLAVLTPALAAVRETNPRRPVVIDGEFYANLAQLAGSPMPNDRFVVPTFHFYDPNNFAFESAPWMTPTSRSDYGTAADLAALDASLRTLVRYMDETGRVPFVGEYGAHEIRPLAERAEYYRTVTRAFASVGVQSCAWGYVNTFNLRRQTGGWYGAIVDGIATTTTLPR